MRTISIRRIFSRSQLPLILLLMASGCDSPPEPVPAEDSWYLETRAEILHQSDLKSDSISFSTSPDGYVSFSHYYNRKHEFKRIGTKNGNVRSQEIFFSSDGQFELRRQYCDNGQIGNEAIFYHLDEYGPSYWWDCGGWMYQKSLYFKGEKTGKWLLYEYELRQGDTVKSSSILKYDGEIDPAALPVITQSGKASEK